MTLMTRVARLFRADFHAVLDRIEEPELLLRQAIREMEDELVRQEQAIRLALGEQADCAARAARLDERIREIRGQLDLCFAQGKEDLARSLVRRKLETERLGRLLTERRESLADTLARRQAVLNENQAALDGLRQKAELVTVRTADRDEYDPAEPFARPPAVSAEEIEIAFLDEQQARRAQARGQS